VRHLAWLAREDEIVIAALNEEWKRVLAAKSKTSWGKAPGGGMGLVSFWPGLLTTRRIGCIARDWRNSRR
jgi:hypothetical protein